MQHLFLLDCSRTLFFLRTPGHPCQSLTHNVKDVHLPVTSPFPYASAMPGDCPLGQPICSMATSYGTGTFLTGMPPPPQSPNSPQNSPPDVTCDLPQG